jgi:hypothetical protein
MKAQKLTSQNFDAGFRVSILTNHATSSDRQNPGTNSYNAPDKTEIFFQRIIVKKPKIAPAMAKI